MAAVDERKELFEQNFPLNQSVNMEPPIETMRVSIQSLSSEVATQAHRIHPVLAKVVSQFFPNPQADDAQQVEQRHRFGLDNMAAVAALMFGPITPEMRGELQQTIDIYNAYFMGEKFSDDLEKLDEDGFSFLNPRQITQFNAGMRRAFEISDEEERLSHIMQFTGEIETAHITTEIRLLIQEKLATAPPQLIAFLPTGFMENPERYFLAINAYAGARLYHHLSEIASRSPELEQLAVHGQQGLFNRYGGMDAVVEDPQAPIDQAIRTGKETILTDVFAGLFLVAADIAKRNGNTVLYEQIVQNQTEIIEATNMHTQMIRLLNDGGHLIVDEARIKPELQYLLENFSEGGQLTPREALRALDAKRREYMTIIEGYINSEQAHLRERFAHEGLSHSIQTHIFASLRGLNGTHEHIRHAMQGLHELLPHADVLSRILKDAVEGEFNTNLNAGQWQGMAVADQWQLLEYNLGVSAIEYAQLRQRFAQSLTYLRDNCYYAYNWLGRFVLFNVEMYGREGLDYDRLVPWHQLESMVEPIIPFEERLAA